MSPPRGRRAIASKLGLSDFPSGSAVLLAALAVSNVSGYVFYVAMSRLLSADRYGALGALIAAITVIAVPAAAVQTVIARRVAADGGAGVDALVRGALRGIAPFAIAAAVALLAVSPWAARFMHLGSVVPAALLAPYLLVALLAPVLRGAVHGLLRYGVLAAALVTITLVRLGLGTTLVALGRDVTGVAVAFVLAEVCGLIPTAVSLRPVRRIPRPAPPGGLLRELGRACLVVAAFSATTNLDVVQVRHYFPHAASGRYAAAALVGRAILLASMSIVMLAFPRFAQEPDAGRGSILASALTFTGVVAAGATIFVALTARPLMSVAFGGAYGAAANVARVSALGSALYAMSGLLMYFHLSTTSRAALLTGPAVLAQTVAIALRHSSILEVAWVTTIVAAALAAANVAVLLSRRRLSPAS